MWNLFWNRKTLDTTHFDPQFGPISQVGLGAYSNNWSMYLLLKPFSSLEVLKGNLIGFEKIIVPPHSIPNKSPAFNERIASSSIRYRIGCILESMAWNGL